MEFLHHLSQYLIKCFPNKTKRFTYLSAAVGYIKKDPDQDLLKKVNEVLQLTTSNQEVMNFPVKYPNWFLTKEDRAFIKEIQSSDKDKISTIVINHIPEHLRYGSDNLIRNDIEKLVTLLA